MNLRTRRSRQLSAVAAIAIAAVALAGCTRGGGGSSDSDEVQPSPGITDTSIKLGITTPLSGPTAGPGTCTVAGYVAYFGARNAEGGIEFGDGKTRTVEIVPLDDMYDPARAVANFNQLVNQEQVFGIVGNVGTPTNLAIRDIANEQEVPHVMLTTGASLFSDDQENYPWTLGFLPTYQDEGRAFGEMLVEAGEPITVAVLRQNDDFGSDYYEGLVEAIEGSQVEIVGDLTFEPTDAAVDAQVTQLAATNADVLFSANPISTLQIATLLKAQELGWFPRWFLPSNTSTPSIILDPGNASVYEHIYSTALQKAAVPTSTDPEVQEFLANMQEYASDITTTYTPHCAWMYAAAATLEEAFKKMTEPTRANFMEALKSIEGFDPPMLDEGVLVNTTDPTRPPVTEVFITEFDGTTYVSGAQY